MEGRSAVDFFKASVEQMTAERVIGVIGFITIGAFLADRSYSLYSSVKRANTLESCDFDMMKKRKAQITELLQHAEASRKSDSLGAELEEINSAIRVYHRITAKAEAAELTTNKKLYAKLLYRRAENYYIQGNYKRAESDLKKALENDQALVCAHNFLLHLYVDTDELCNKKMAQACLQASLTANSEQTFAKYYEAVTTDEQIDMELVNRLAQQLVTDLKNPACHTRSTIPLPAAALMMARCMQENIAYATNPDVLQHEYNLLLELSKIEGLFINKQLYLIVNESIAQARLKLAELMGERGHLIARSDQDEFYQHYYASEDPRVNHYGYLSNHRIVFRGIVDDLIKPVYCEQYLGKQEHRAELWAVMQGFAAMGMFEDKEYAELKQQCTSMQSLDDFSLFIEFIKNQGPDVWTIAVPDLQDQTVFHSLINIACADAGKNMRVYESSGKNQVNSLREYRYQPEQLEYDVNQTLKVVYLPEQKRFHVMLDIGKPVDQLRYLVLKQCEAVLAQHPGNKAFTGILNQMGFMITQRKAIVKPSSGSMFSRVAYPLLVLGGIAAVCGAANTLLKK